jgi:hypothetical protein
MHTCDNPPCIRPEHLTVGTTRDNAADCHAKGRAATDNLGHFCRSKTHCTRGHPYSGENLQVLPNGHRVCRACRRIYNRQRKSR